MTMLIDTGWRPGDDGSEPEEEHSRRPWRPDFNLRLWIPLLLALTLAGLGAVVPGIAGLGLVFASLGAGFLALEYGLGDWRGLHDHRQ